MKPMVCLNASPNSFLEPLTKPLILRYASLSYDWYCLRRRALAQVLCEVLLAAINGQAELNGGIAIGLRPSARASWSRLP